MKSVISKLLLTIVSLTFALQSLASDKVVTVYTNQLICNSTLDKMDFIINSIPNSDAWLVAINQSGVHLAEYSSGNALKVASASRPYLQQVTSRYNLLLEGASLERILGGSSGHLELRGKISFLPSANSLLRNRTFQVNCRGALFSRN
jgi:hypothetical protein